jgi:hypothetical protein
MRRLSAARAALRDLVRDGYDAISLGSVGDDGQAASSSAKDVSRYAGGSPNWPGQLDDGQGRRNRRGLHEFAAFVVLVVCRLVRL